MEYILKTKKRVCKKTKHWREGRNMRIEKLNLIGEFITSCVMEEDPPPARLRGAPTTVPTAAGGPAHDAPRAVLARTRP